MKQLFLDIAGKTDLGTARELNEDSCMTALGEKGLAGGVRAVLAVSDGMGGHDAGDVASKIACEYLEHLFAKGNYVRFAQEWEIAADDYPGLLKEAFLVINRKIMDRARSFNLQRTMGCTCVVCLVIYDECTDQWRLAIGNIGDSRCYLLRRREILLATEDDSVVWQLYKKKEITYAEMRLHPKRNVLTQALGIQDSIRPSIRMVDLQENDALLLCSDGLHATVSEEEIRKIILSSVGADDAVQKLTALANHLGAKDNIAAAVISCKGEKSKERSQGSIRMTRSLMVALPVVLLGVGSAVLLNSSPGIPETEIFPHTITLRSGSPRVDTVGTLAVRFSLEPYSLIDKARNRYGIIRTQNNQRDTIPLSRIPEISRNLFQLPCKILPGVEGSLRLTLVHAQQQRPLYESTLIVDARRNPEPPQPARSIAHDAAPRVSEVRTPRFPVTIARGQDGYLQVSLEKRFDLRDEVTAELSVGGVVEILTLNKQDKVVPKSTSIEYRSGASVQIRLLGTQHAWTTTLP